MSELAVERIQIPVLPLRDVVVYPHMVIPLFVGREKSIQCLEAAMEQNKQIFLVAQKDPTVENPEKGDLYEVGTLSTILQLLKLPDGTVKVLVEGEKRAKLHKFLPSPNYFVAEVEVMGTASEREERLLMVQAEAGLMMIIKSKGRFAALSDHPGLLNATAPNQVIALLRLHRLRRFSQSQPSVTHYFKLIRAKRTGNLESEEEA